MIAKLFADVESGSTTADQAATVLGEVNGSTKPDSIVEKLKLAEIAGAAESAPLLARVADIKCCLATLKASHARMLSLCARKSVDLHDQHLVSQAKYISAGNDANASLMQLFGDPGRVIHVQLGKYLRGAIKSSIMHHSESMKDFLFYLNRPDAAASTFTIAVAGGIDPNVDVSVASEVALQ